MLHDRLLSRLLWASVLGLITIAGGAALIFAGQGFFDLVAGEWNPAAGHLGLAVLLAVAAYCIVRNAEDLMDRGYADRHASRSYSR